MSSRVVLSTKGNYDYGSLISYHTYTFGQKRTASNSILVKTEPKPKSSNKKLEFYNFGRVGEKEKMVERVLCEYEMEAKILDE